MTQDRSRPFSAIKTVVIPIARVRVVQQLDRVSRVNNGWDVQYLPVGKSRWWWNWRTYRRERTEQTARDLANVLIAEGHVALTAFETNEVQR
jgi:hypothetical protein